MTRRDGLTWNDLVRLEIPDLSDEQCEYVLWNHTGYPSFFMPPYVMRCRQQVRAFKQRLADGAPFCHDVYGWETSRDASCPA